MKRRTLQMVLELHSMEIRDLESGAVNVGTTHQKQVRRPASLPSQSLSQSRSRSNPYDPLPKRPSAAHNPGVGSADG